MNHNGDTAETAYLINDTENLKLLRDRVNSQKEPYGKYYKLTADLDLTSESSWEPIGYKLDEYGEIGSSTATYFSGHFDGDSHTILVSFDRTIRNTGSVKVYAGLFGVVRTKDSSSPASISNLNVKGNVKARASTNSEGYSEAGGIAIYADGYYTVIENCTFDGIINAVHEGTGVARAGGIVVYNTIEIKNCEVKSGSLVSAVSSSTDSDKSFAGGITGVNGQGSIDGCTSRARIINAQRRGGIIGESSNEEKILDNKYSGALWGIGSIGGNGSDEGCTYDPISIEILTKSLSPANGIVEQRYEAAQFEASEVKNVKWEIISGDIPGITLGTSGILSGVPTSADTYNFDVQVSITGFENLKDTASYTLTITQEEEQPNNPNDDTPSGSGGGGGCNFGFSLLTLVSCAVLFLRKTEVI